MYSMLVDLRCVLCRKWCCQVDVKSFAEYKYDGGEYRLMPAFTVITSLLEALDFFGRITSIIWTCHGHMKEVWSSNCRCTEMLRSEDEVLPYQVIMMSISKSYSFFIPQIIVFTNSQNSMGREKIDHLQEFTILHLDYVSSLLAEKKILASFLAETIILRVTMSMCVRLLDRLRSSY